jgi:hypothetical protein
MPFCKSERDALLAVKGVGPTVVKRLEEQGFVTLAQLSRANTLDIVTHVSAALGSTCWKNSPQARSALDAAIACAKAAVAKSRGQQSNASDTEGAKIRGALTVADVATQSPEAPWGRHEFLAELFERFPGLKSKQDKSANGLLHCEVGWFSHKTSEAIEIGAFRSVRHHFEFVDFALARASDALENAVMVSYLENVFAQNTDNTRRARNLLTPRLAAHIVEMEGHFIAAVEGTLPPISVTSNKQDVAELERRISGL